MPPTTETEVKELRDLVIGLREEIRVGFAQNDTKLSEFKAEIKSEIQLAQQDSLTIPLRLVAGGMRVI
jgi:hypothetical protein